MADVSSLPDPDAHPNRDVVIYDGDCQFCQAQVLRLARWDRWSAKLSGGRALSFLSLHDPRVSQRYPDLTHQMLMEEMYVVDQQRRRHRGADAVRYLSRRLPLLWPVMPILHIPGSAGIWRWGYRQIARQRYRWNQDACEGDSCAVHFEQRHDSRSV